MKQEKLQKNNIKIGFSFVTKRELKREIVFRNIFSKKIYIFQKFSNITLKTKKYKFHKTNFLTLVKSLATTF